MIINSEWNYHWRRGPWRRRGLDQWETHTLKLTHTHTPNVDGSTLKDICFFSSTTRAHPNSTPISLFWVATPFILACLSVVPLFSPLISPRQTPVMGELCCHSWCSVENKRKSCYNSHLSNGFIHLMVNTRFFSLFSFLLLFGTMVVVSVAECQTRRRRRKKCDADNANSSVNFDV